MKSICATALLVLAAAACSKNEPVDTTRTTSAEALPAADTNVTTPPPAVPELGKDGRGASKVTSTRPSTMSSPNADGTTTASNVTMTDVDDLAAMPAEPVAAPAMAQGTSTTTTVTTTTVKKKPVEKQSDGYGTGAARHNGINSTGPVGNGGGGVR